MARKYCSGLTKEMLLEWGITDIKYLPDFGYERSEIDRDNWWIDRLWYSSGKNTVKKHKRLRVHKAVCKHKYTSDKYYFIITFSIGTKVMSLPLARVIYAWFIGPIADGEVIDHKDNNPFYNHPTNLQKLSVGENLAKRYTDNVHCNLNQYTTEKYKAEHNKNEI